jgi:maleate isomerase
MQHVTPEELRAMNAQTGRAATELADVRPDVVASDCLVAIMVQGFGYHCTAEADIIRALRAVGSPAPALSSAGALLSGIAALGARRVAIITPYLKPLTEQVVDYIEAAGTEVVDALSLEVSDNLAVANLDPDGLREHWKKLDITNADAIVLSACVQMPSLSAIPAVEEQSGCPSREGVSQPLEMVGDFTTVVAVDVEEVDIVHDDQSVLALGDAFGGAVCEQVSVMQTGRSMPNSSADSTDVLA